MDFDLIVTVVLLFINSELLDSGKNEWRAHVEGAMKLISCLKPFGSVQLSPIALIRDRIASDCLTTLFNPCRLPLDITTILKRAEANSYLSFPTTLLQTLFRACELSNMQFPAPTSDNPTYVALRDEASSLLKVAHSFDVNSWANTVEGIHSPRTSVRLHTALAHQNAKALSPTHLIHHLPFIDPRDSLVKATSWTTFIAGAETDNLEYRQWALDRLNRLWSVLPWGYVQTAVEVMQMAWYLRDTSVLDHAETVGWVEPLVGHVNPRQST
ncbi:hypothetical protein BBP40_001252 [Aspergillus hancockii]|nr:hypothetical protein BBP40_001252 [Aspergillus hancockii]